MRSGTVVSPPSLPLGTAVFSRVDGGVEGMALRRLILLCTLPPSCNCFLFYCDGGGERHGYTRSGTFVPPHSSRYRSILSLDGERRVWS